MHHSWGRGKPPITLFLLQDARPEEEYNISHIPGAVRVDYKADPDKLSEALPQLKDPGNH